MVIEVVTKIGLTTYKFVLDDADEMSALHKAAVLGNPRRYCNVCQNDKYFQLDSNKDKDGNTYVNVLCTAKDCWAKSKLGQYKTKGYFWHEFKKYSKGEKQDPNDDNHEYMDNLMNEGQEDMPF